MIPKGGTTGPKETRRHLAQRHLVEAATRDRISRARPDLPRGLTLDRSL